jgi:citrate (Re)-synthase
MGYYADCQPDFTALNELANLYAKMGQPLADKYPLYGRDAHRTRAGIHADGLNKFWWMYAPFDVPRLIGRQLEVSLTKDSGIAGLTFVAHGISTATSIKKSPEYRRHISGCSSSLTKDVRPQSNGKKSRIFLILENYFASGLAD